MPACCKPEKKNKKIVKFLGKFSLVRQLLSVIVDSLVYNSKFHNPFVTCVSNLQKKYRVKGSENYKCKTGKVC